MRNFIKKITHPFLKYGLKLFYSKPRNYSYDNICIKVHPDVFPPHLTFSTKNLLNYINTIDLKEKTFLELGCGSGIISLLASKKGAVVSSSDINQTALNYLDINAVKNNLLITTIFSDLFKSIPNSNFDFIIINPPYYPKKPKNIKEKAWFCGENFEYFENLFEQLPKYLKNNIKCYVILSEDCDIKTIQSIAVKNNIFFSLELVKSNSFEKNYIYNLT
jgi:release factor glutamine methyltransferase